MRHVAPGAAWYSVLDSLQAQVLLARIGYEEDQGWRIAAPWVSVLNAQRASLFVLSQTAYIQDYAGTQPVMGIVNDGMTLGLRALREGDGHLRVAGTARTCTLLGMEKLPFGTDGLCIELPHVTSDEIAFNVQMAEGQTLALYGGIRQGKDAAHPKTAMWLITPHVEKHAAQEPR